jgi:uncharacterized protein
LGAKRQARALDGYSGAFYDSAVSDSPTTVTATPLTDAEFENLANVLKRFGGRQSMNIEQLDGFLAAIVCCPSEVPKTEYLPEVWGDEMVNEDNFAAQLILQNFLSLVERHKCFIQHTLQSGDVFTPLLLTDRNGGFLGNDWAAGFTRAMNLRKSEWLSLLNDDDHGGYLVPILALAHEHDPDPEMRPYREPISEERRENLIIGAAAGVINIYRYFRGRHEVAEMAFDTENSTYRRLRPKTGRNDPCPCGSGKKFKHCCGKITLH